MRISDWSSDVCSSDLLGHLRIAQVRVELGADEVVVVPQRGLALLGAPLVVAEDHHGDRRPLLAADRAPPVHRAPVGPLPGEPHPRPPAPAALGADHRGKTVYQQASHARSTALTALLAVEFDIS